MECGMMGLAGTAFPGPGRVGNMTRLAKAPWFGIPGQALLGTVLVLVLYCTVASHTLSMSKLSIMMFTRTVLHTLRFWRHGKHMLSAERRSE